MSEIIKYAVTIIMVSLLIGCDNNNSNPAGNDPVMDQEPWHIIVYSNPSEISVLDSTRNIQISAIVFDSLGDRLGYGVPVQFSTTAGDINSVDLTDSNGVAHGYLFPGRNAGYFGVFARYCNSPDTLENDCWIEILPGPPETIITTTNPDTIWAPDKEDNHISRAVVYVRDVYGNLVDFNWVVFEILNEPESPEGISFEDGSHRIIEPSVNGIAVTQVKAGTMTGRKTIRAYTWHDSTNFPDQVIESICDSLIVQ
ncbi:MAG: hypothetical protein HN356_13400 [Calditrichaeota bacterium]|nr:hypothetical protein [Calditrichota bacterium]